MSTRRHLHEPHEISSLPSMFLHVGVIQASECILSSRQGSTFVPVERLQLIQDALERPRLDLVDFGIRILITLTLHRLAEKQEPRRIDPLEFQLGDRGHFRAILLGDRCLRSRKGIRHDVEEVLIRFTPRREAQLQRVPTRRGLPARRPRSGAHLRVSAVARRLFRRGRRRSVRIRLPG